MEKLVERSLSLSSLSVSLEGGLCVHISANHPGLVSLLSRADDEGNFTPGAIKGRITEVSYGEHPSNPTFKEGNTLSLPYKEFKAMGSPEFVTERASYAPCLDND